MKNRILLSLLTLAMGLSSVCVVSASDEARDEQSHQDDQRPIFMNISMPTGVNYVLLAGAVIGTAIGGYISFKESQGTLVGDSRTRKGRYVQYPMHPDCVAEHVIGGGIIGAGTGILAGTFIGALIGKVCGSDTVEQHIVDIKDFKISRAQYDAEIGKFFKR